MPLWQREYHQLRPAGLRVVQCRRCGLTTQSSRVTQVTGRMCVARRLLTGGEVHPTDWGAAFVRLLGWWRGPPVPPGPSVAALLGAQPAAPAPAGLGPASGPGRASADQAALTPPPQGEVRARHSGQAQDVRLHSEAAARDHPLAAQRRSRSPRRPAARPPRGRASADREVLTRPHSGGPGPSRGFVPGRPSPSAHLAIAHHTTDSSDESCDGRAQIGHGSPGRPGRRSRHEGYRSPSDSSDRRRVRPRRCPLALRASAAATAPPGPPHCLVPTVAFSVCLACGWCALGLADAVALVGSGCRGWSPALPRAALAFLRSPSGVAALAALPAPSPALLAASRRSLTAPSGVG